MHRVRCDAALPCPSLSGSDHTAYLLPAPLPPCLHVATGRAPPPTSSSALGPPHPPFLPSLLQHSRCRAPHRAFPSSSVSPHRLSPSTPPSSLRGTIRPLTPPSTVSFPPRRRRHSIPSVSTTPPCSFSANDARLSPPSLILSCRNTSPSLATTASPPPPVNTLASSRFYCLAVATLLGEFPLPHALPGAPTLPSCFPRDSFIHFQKFVQDS
jgi:hypothetical protein